MRGQTALPLSLKASLILARGQLRPPLHPPEQDLRPVHPTRRASPSGLPTAVSTAASTRRAFVPSIDLQTGAISSAPGPSTVGRIRSPPGPPSTMGLAPWTRAGGVPPLPPDQPSAGWMPRLRHAHAPGEQTMPGLDSDSARRRSARVHTPVCALTLYLRRCRLAEGIPEVVTIYGR